MNSKLRAYLLVLTPLFVLGSLAVYIFTLSPGAFPGDSASLIAYHTRLDPFDTLLQPVWGAVIRVIAIFAGSNAAYILNLFSALCGALSVGLLLFLVASIPHNKTAEEGRAHFSASRTQCLSGIAAALFFAFSIPFWTVSTRAHYLTFEVLMLLICTWIFMQVWERKSRRLLYVFAALYGLGMVQSASFILAAPVFAIMLLFRLWQREMLNLNLLVKVALWGLVGLLVILPAAIRFRFSPAYEWREIDNFFLLLWYLIRDQGNTALASVRRLGWMLVLLTTVLPWFVIVAITKKSSTDWSGRVGSFLLHLVVTILGVLLVFNISPAPMAILQDGAHLVFPYLVAAVWFGYVVGYWYALIAGRRMGSRQDRPIWQTSLQTGWALLVIAALLVAGFRNASAADGRSAQPALIMANAIVDNMGDRDWLISNGMLDANIYIAAAQKGRQINILNPRLANIPAYLQYMASLMDDPRLKGLAQLGLGPLLNEWMQSDPQIEQRLAILSAPEIWVEAGFYPLPEVALFGGSRQNTITDADAYLAQHQTLWNALLDTPAPDEDQAPKPIDAWIRQHASKIANNAGVLLEDNGFNTHAFECYTRAQELDANNISAMMNQLSLAQRENRPETDTLDEVFEAFIADRDQSISLWALSSDYGYVRDPQAFVQQGMAWAHSGRLRSAATDVERAISITGTSPQLQHMLAALYLRGDRQTESIEIYEQLLDENPQDASALLALMRFALARGDAGEARRHWDRLARLDVRKEGLIVEQVTLKLLENQAEEVRPLLDQHLRNNPDDARTWALLLTLAQQANDRDAVERALNELIRIGSPVPELQLAVAQGQIFMGYLPAARETLNRIIQRHPGHVATLENLLRLDVIQGDQASATRYVERLLTADANNSLANYILGSLQVARRDFALAENSMRRSLQRTELPEALNDLGWLLIKRGAYDEAEPLIRRALEKQPRQPYAWSNLGMILMAQDQMAEAGEALHFALQLQPGNPLIQLNVAEYYMRQDLRQDAMNLLEEVNAVLSVLPEDERLRAIELSTRLRSE
jgi:tetratricopeptide (TPR) repeat protein